MTETADVVIIGSGIVGSSVAYHLADQGCTNVLVVEREAHQGKGTYRAPAIPQITADSVQMKSLYHNGL